MFDVFILFVQSDAAVAPESNMNSWGVDQRAQTSEPHLPDCACQHGQGLGRGGCQVHSRRAKNVRFKLCEAR